MVAPVVWMVVGAWMLAITYVDYPMANHGIEFAKSSVARLAAPGACSGSASAVPQ